MNAKAYCGFNAEQLNSNQPLPRDRKAFRIGPCQSVVLADGLAIRKRYGINLWMDGTVCTGWRLLVHSSDYDRATLMLKSL